MSETGHNFYRPPLFSLMLRSRQRSWYIFPRFMRRRHLSHENPLLKSLLLGRKKLENSCSSWIGSTSRGGSKVKGNAHLPNEFRSLTLCIPSRGWVLHVASTLESMRRGNPFGRIDRALHKQFEQERGSSMTSIWIEIWLWMAAWGLAFHLWRLQNFRTFWPPPSLTAFSRNLPYYPTLLRLLFQYPASSANVINGSPLNRIHEYSPVYL